MPSSITTQYGMTAADVVNTALRSLRVLVEGDTANSAQMTDGLTQLNMIVKSLATMPQGMKLWTYGLLEVPLIAGQIEYRIGPGIGANVFAPRPIRVMEYGNFYRQTFSGQNYDTPLRLISRTEYLQFGSKGSVGQPNSIYYLPGIDTITTATAPTGYGTLFVYLPLSTTATGSVWLNHQRHIYDINSETESVDFPPEWFTFLKWKLMAEWADEFEVPEERIARYKKNAQEAGEACADWSVEEAPVTFGVDNTGNYK